MLKRLKLSRLKLDKRLQMRQNGINTDTVDAYTISMEKGEEFPAITVFDVDGTNYVVDGYHRAKASEANNAIDMECEVRVGTWEQALNYATFEANRKNGMRLTRSDLQAIVERLVMDDQYAEYPSQKLADLAGVSHHTVQAARNRLGRRPERVLKEDGTYYQLRSQEPVDLIEGPPEQGIKMPRERYRVLSEKVLDRLFDHIDDIALSIQKLEGDDLIQWISSEKRQELLADINRLYKLVEGE